MSSQEASHDFGDFSGSSEGLRELDELTAFLLSSDLPFDCEDGPSDKVIPSDSLRRQRDFGDVAEDLRESVTAETGLLDTSQASGGIGGWASCPDTLDVPHKNQEDPAILAPCSAQTRTKMPRRLAPADNLSTGQQTIHWELPCKRPRPGCWLDPEAEDSNSQTSSKHSEDGKLETKCMPPSLAGPLPPSDALALDTWQPSVSGMSPQFLFEDEPLPLMSGLPSEDRASTSYQIPANAQGQQTYMRPDQQFDVPHSSSADAAPGHHSRIVSDSRSGYQAPKRQQKSAAAAANSQQQQLVNQQQRPHQKRLKHGRLQQQQQHCPLGLNQSEELPRREEELNEDPTAPRSITTPHTIEMARVLSSLCGSSSSSERLAALGKVNGLRGILGSGAVNLRLQHLKDMLPNPGWNTVVPADGGILRIYQALENGIARTPVRLSHIAFQHITNLDQILRVPMDQRLGIMRNMAGRIVQAKQRSQSPGDEHHIRALHLAGESVIIGVVFLSLGKSDTGLGALQLHGQSMTSAAPSSFIPNWNRVKGQLKLSKHQIAAAKHAWKCTSTALAQVQAARAQLLSGILSCNIDAAVQQACIGHEAHSTVKLLDQAAALAENAALQQEIMLQGIRLMLFNIATPELTLQLVCGFFPLFTDWLGVLKHIAEDD